MTKIAYFDCPTGISGDMCLGALVDAGVRIEYLIEQLQGLGLGSEYQLWQETVHRQGQAATKVHVDLLQKRSDHHTSTTLSHHTSTTLSHQSSTTLSHHHARHLPEIEQIIQTATLPDRVKDWSLQIFQKLAIAEGLVHGIAPEQVHFHEVGATDAIVDIVGTCLGLDYLGIEKIYSSALPTGGGTVWAAHGRLSVPVPAVLKLWESRQVPVYHNGIDKELVTPTGAAILVTLAESFGPPPQLQLQKMGLGAGSQDFTTANILRLWLGESISHDVKLPAFVQSEKIAILETQIDDLNLQIIGYLFEVLFKVGAIDVFTQPVGMKKSRPGILLTVLCHLDAIAACQEVIFRETSTLGIRYSIQDRAILKREIQTVQTPYGEVRVKIAYTDNLDPQNILNIQPEYEDCAELAQKTGYSLQTIQQSAITQCRSAIATWHKTRL